MPSQDDHQHELPLLVERWRAGDETAFDRVVELVYDDLRSIAHRHLETERANHTLDTTALVHEAYMAMSERTGPEWRGQPQFYALLSRVMRHVLIDHARKRRAEKRGGGEIHLSLDDQSPRVDSQIFELLAINDVLERLEARDERLARIVECRFFGGMAAPEIAKALGISARTVERGWTRARAYLFSVLEADGPNPDSASPADA